MPETLIESNRISIADAARDMIRRKRCRDSLHSFAMNIDIPTAPRGALCPDESMTGPAAALMAKHHAAILSVCERTVKRPYGRAIIMAPPGTAKSTYVSVVTPPWAMGRLPGQRIILTSYGSTLAERQSRRCRTICEQQLYRDLWDVPLLIEKDSDKEWSMNNKGELLAAGLLAGITGSRANGAIIDDPVAGREEADSPATRLRTLNAYQDDLLTRLLPGAWLIIIMTRWNEQDLVGEILPLDYKGQSGMIRCRDDMDWEVLNIQAKCEQPDDPVGRKIGEYLWTDYYPEKHWRMFEMGVGPTRQRTWSSLYQQRPSPQGSGQFTREMIHYYDELPKTPIVKVIGSDHAVTEGKNDFTEHGVIGLDPDDNLYIIDWWHKQCNTGEGVENWLRLVDKHGIHMGFHEGGVIDKAIGPLVTIMTRDWNAKAIKNNTRRIFVDIRPIPSIMDKMAKLSSFQGRCAQGKVFFPRRMAGIERIIDQLLAAPASRYDDASDVLGLVGRGLEQYHPPAHTVTERKVGIKPFSPEWLEYEENSKPAVRYR